MTDLQHTRPDIIQEESVDDCVNIDLLVSESIDYFKGHFPEAAILPGVTQLDWAINFIKHHYKMENAIIKRIEVLKFQNVIMPDSKVQLHLEKKNNEKYVFKYISDKGVHSSGRIVLEA